MSRIKRGFLFVVCILLLSGCLEFDPGVTPENPERYFAKSIKDCAEILAIWEEKRESFEDLVAVLLDNPGHSFNLFKQPVTYVDALAPIMSTLELSADTCAIYNELNIDFLDEISYYNYGEGFILHMMVNNYDDFTKGVPVSVDFEIKTSSYNARLCYTPTGEEGHYSFDYKKQYIVWLDDNWYIEYYLNHLV